MSRWEIARETIAGVLKGRENEFSLKEETPTYARVFFRMAYWRETDYSDTVKALNREGFAVVGWTIHGGGEGLNVELLIVGGPDARACEETSAHFEYEDHTYKTEEEAHEILTNVSEVRICKPGDHDWDSPSGGSWSPDICEKCGLVKIPHQSRARPKDLSINQIKELVEEMEKTDPEGAELLKRKLLTGVVEG